jgi:flagellum-specific ATP synthase
MNDIVSPEQLAVRGQLVSLMAIYKKAEDLINIGAYVEGSNPQIDYAIKKMPEINEFLCQGINEKAGFDDCLNRLKMLLR